MARRTDPTGTNRRSFSGGLASKIKNQDPGRKYVGVYARDERALDMYYALGYRAETYQEDGAQWARGMRKPTIGGEQVHNGMLLMSIANEDAETLQREGAEQICGGLDEADRVERSMRKSTGSFNPLSGLENSGSGLVKAHIPKTNPSADALCDA